MKVSPNVLIVPVPRDLPKSSFLQFRRNAFVSLRVNPELWDGLQDKTKSREYSFQSFQKNLIKGIEPVVQLAIFKSC